MCFVVQDEADRVHRSVEVEVESDVEVQVDHVNTVADRPKTNMNRMSRQSR